MFAPLTPDGMCYSGSDSPLVILISGLWNGLSGVSCSSGSGCVGSPDADTCAVYLVAWVFAVGVGVDPGIALTILPSPPSVVHNGPAPQVQQQISYAAAQRWQAQPPTQSVRRTDRGSNWKPENASPPT